jgi:NAD(P)H-dependent FMN reductase
MIEIISGTNRPNSNTIKVAKFVVEIFNEIKIPVNLLDLAHLDLNDVADGEYYKGARGGYKEAVERMTKARGILVVVPEYNGSYPGALKLFIDYWKYPETFEHRPLAFVGLGSRWGGLSPVEHLQQVFGFRNGYIFPQRVFLTNIKDNFKDGKVTDPKAHDLLKAQARDFVKFIHALESQGLDANSRLKK